MAPFALLALLVLRFANAFEVSIENPPPEQVIDPEWTLVPTELGDYYLVHTETALHEPQPLFNVDEKVIFELYTPESPNVAQILRIGDVHSILSSNFNAKRNTRIGCHGWNTDGSLTTTFQKAYFEDGNHDVNFISVNWQAGSNTINYIGARNRVPAVGQGIARLVDFLVDTVDLDIEQLILFGHSLGAHIVGIAGKHVRSGLLPKIIALDPANPLFSESKPAERVAVGDARTVELIHTAAGSLGFSTPLGDASFYPNGGKSQPGCGLDLTNGCSHSRSVELYAESINTDIGFYSYNCGSYAEVKKGRCNVVGEMRRMGGDPGNQGAASGVYFLETNKRAPFAQGNPQ